LSLQYCHELAGNLIDVIAGVVELQVGDGAGGAAYRLPVHAADEAEKRCGPRERTQDVVPLVVQGRTANLDQSGVVRPAVQAQLAQPGRIERLGWFGRGRTLTAAFVEPAHGRMLGEVHDNGSCRCICKHHSTKAANQLSALASRSFLAARLSKAIPSSPSNSVACRCAFSQAGTAFSISRLPWVVNRKGWARASSSGTTSSHPCARIRSTLRLRVDASSCRISQTWTGRARPSLAVTIRMFNWLTFRPKGRKASS